MDKSAGPTNSNTSVRRTSLVLLLVIALLNTMGITIILPIVPFLTLKYLAHPNNLAIIVGWLTAAYGFCQLIAAPALGVLSDRFGRRPILFICLLGSVSGYLILGLGGALWLLFLGRIIDGLIGGFMYTAWGHFQVYASASFIIVLAIVCVWIAIPRLQRYEAKEQTLVE